MERRHLLFEIRFSSDADDHLWRLQARDRSLLVSAIEQQLRYEPRTATRNRKPLRPNPLAPWVLRVGQLRVYYEVTIEPERVVIVRAIGVKVRERVTIGGTEVDLA